MRKIVGICLLSFLSLYCLGDAAIRETPLRPLNPAPGEGKTSLDLRRIVLYSNGVAYFERRGKVSGKVSVNLTFKESEVADVLKSLVVIDLGGGSIGTVSYPTSSPASVQLGEIPFSIEAGSESSSGTGGMGGILMRLQGARLMVTTGGRSATGTLLTLEKRTAQLDAQKPPVITEFLVIAFENGEITRFDLSEVRSVRLLDEGTRKDVARFAEVSAQTRRQNSQSIIITTGDEGPHELLVSYTVAAPVWKTTYRIVLDKNGNPFFQGWAIVDNVTGNDWNDVSLSLISGSPISFIHPIQYPLYRQRSVLHLPEALSLHPQIIKESDIIFDSGTSVDPRIGVGSGKGAGVGPGEGGGFGGGVYRVGGGVTKSDNPSITFSDAIIEEAAGIRTAATGKQVGDLFEYHIEKPVTIRAHQSAMIPILQQKMEGERVALFDAASQGDRPWSGIRLKNTSSLTLEGGSLTVIDEDTYVGESMLERLRPGEERLLSFAVDLGTRVTIDKKGDRAPTFMVRTIKGVFQAHYYEKQSTAYEIKNQTDKPRVVYLEHLLQDQWRLAPEVAKPTEKDGRTCRYRLTLEPQGSTKLFVIERRALMENYQISNLSKKNMELFLSMNYLDEKGKQQLERVLELKNNLFILESRLLDADHEIQEISTDQSRFRENIKVLTSTREAQPLIARYIAKADQQENRLAELVAEKKKAGAEKLQQQQALDTLVANMAWERKLNE